MADKEELSGRELDAAVAERLFNATLVHVSSGWGTAAIDSGGIRSESSCKFCGRVASDQDLTVWQERCVAAAPRYSTSIEAAMEVVKKMRSDGWSFACTLYEGKLPYASFCKGTAASSRNAEAESLEEAICRAALKAISSNA